MSEGGKAKAVPKACSLRALYGCSCLMQIEIHQTLQTCLYIYKTNTLNTWFIEISDPVAYASGRLKLVSQQRQARGTLENEIDIEHTDELTKLSAHVLLDLFNELQKRDKCEACRAFYCFLATSLINSIIQNHEC